MASLFEQYEQATLQSSSAATTKLAAALDEKQAEPMFTKRRVNFSPSAPVTHMVVSNGQLVVAMASKKILRVDLAQPDEQEEIDVRHRLSNLFLDFTGNHLLMVVSGSHDVLYLNRHSRKPKMASKLKGHCVTAVGWDARSATDSSTGAVLVGTSKGLLFEAAFNSVDDKYHAVLSVDQYWKQLRDFGADGATSITGIEFHLIVDADNVAFVIVTTPTRLYQFVGHMPGGSSDPGQLQRILRSDSDVAPRFQEIPSATSSSQLQLFYPGAWEAPRAFAWLTGVGVLHGQLDYGGQAGADNVCADTTLVAFRPHDAPPPLGCVLTQFHVLLCYADRVQAICVLNEDVVIEDTFTETYGSVVCLAKDPVRGAIWACCEYAVYRYSVQHENRHVWQIYLGRGDYALARRHCGGDPELLDVVVTQEARDEFERRHYDDSAARYAESSAPLEEVALRFLSLRPTAPLRLYLLRRLDALRPTPHDRIQLTMLVTWLVELYANELASVGGEGREGLRRQFHAFLEGPRVRDCVASNRHVVYDLAASHGDLDTLAFVAHLVQDDERMIRLHVQNGSYRSALEVLQKQCSPEQYYRFCPLLMERLPAETVDACMALGRRLEPCRLLPALLAHSAAESIRYLEFCVRGLECRDRRVHNALVALYATTAPDRLLPYLTAHHDYDPEFALRTCAGHVAACVHVYCGMGLHEDAVELALGLDVDVARRCAARRGAHHDDDDVRKKLWLKIAHHVVKEECDIEKAMEFLQECDLIKIEDILPFFPNFVTIDHFKDAICQSLQEYNQHIESLKEDMEEATHSTRQIRHEIQAVRNKCITVRSTDRCATCGYPVVARPFYLFPCRHFFHAQCLVAEVAPHLASGKRNRVGELERLDDATSKVELDDIVAAECPYCGDLIIRSIDEPFVHESEAEEVASSWL